MTKKIFIAALAAIVCTGIYAQTTAEQYRERYFTLVKRVGADGVGVETLLEKWDAAYPDDKEMMCARAVFFLVKSKTSRVVEKNQQKYMGEKPIMSLKDSLGVAHNYFEEYDYDDAYFSKADKMMERAIAAYPYDLDLRSNKIFALIGYEKENPDMVVQTIKGLIDYNFSSKPAWITGGEKASGDDFNDLIQRVCYMLFSINSPSGMEAFKSVSEKMLSYLPKSPIFLSNLGSYHLVYGHNPKAALKCYQKVLKIEPGNYPAVKNCVIAARELKDKKLEKKYLELLATVTSNDMERESAKVRAESLGK
ncbi:MAG: hypothetical protein MJY45_03950 [Bacteroidales bacterium]|nr:hypothetical protein [Bacteroidales bacterium]